MESQDIKDVVIGGYTDNQLSQSIFRWNAKINQVMPVGSAINPSYLYTQGQYTYYVAQKTNGQVFTVNKQFKIVSTLPTKGDDPCHISMDAKGRFIVVTNYSSSSFTVFRLQNGIIKDQKYHIVHQGSSINPDRQEKPHPHSSVFTNDSNILFVADLGTDIIYYYNINDNFIQLSKEKSVKLTPGSGPRTLCLGPQNLLFVSCELDASVRAISYKNGLECIDTYKISNDPTHYPSHVSYVNGEVYLASRGNNIMYIFEYIDQFKLKFTFSVGNYPRQFLVLASDIYVACNKEGTVSRYKRNGDKVQLIKKIATPGSSCVALLLWS